MGARDGLELDQPILSDARSLVEDVLGLLKAGIQVHCLRDLTRGGLSSALVGLAAKSDCSMTLRSADIPVRDDVRGACEVLGVDPMQVANQGRFVCFVPAAQAECALGYLQNRADEASAAIIGTVLLDREGVVNIEDPVGGTRRLEACSGDLPPRTC